MFLGVNTDKLSEGFAELNKDGNYQLSASEFEAITKDHILYGILSQVYPALK